MSDQYGIDKVTVCETLRADPTVKRSDQAPGVEAAVVGKSGLIRVCRSDPDDPNKVYGWLDPTTGLTTYDQSANTKQGSQSRPGSAAAVSREPDRRAPQPPQPAPKRPDSVPAQSAGLPTNRTVVTIGGDGYATVRTKVDFFGVSDTTVMIGFIDGPDSNLMEPPVAPPSQPLTVTADGQQYRCGYGGWTVTVAGVVWVVMIRSDP